jgi:hypothetical protein
MPNDIEAQLDALNKMTTSDLADLYRELHGQPCRTRHRAYLIRKNAWRIQANAEGDLSERARKRAAELADDAEVRVMAPKTMICPPQVGETISVTRRLRSDGREGGADPRLPSPGAAIVRTYKGRRRRVVVLDDGQLEFEGQRYRTLSAVAKHITGSHINGFRFFKLGATR